MQESQIAQFNAHMALLPVATGYSPSHWHHGLNVMLEKTPGNYDGECLQIILLFEVDCNQNNKWLGWAFMKEVELRNLLAGEQYGSHWYKDTITQCLNKWLWYDYICCTRQPAALCSNDAKSCYKWIVLLIAALCMCHLGALKSLVLSMLNTIQGMRHHTRTVHRDSTQFASRDTRAQPVAGIGQGNGAGPAICAAVSSPLFTIMKEDGFLATVICAMSHKSFKLSGFAFVDDTDLCVLGQSTATQTATRMQESIANWEGLLRTTGGTLVPEKCFWYLIDKEWSNGKWTYHNIKHTPVNLHVLDANGRSHTIPRLEVMDAQ